MLPNLLAEPGDAAGASELGANAAGAAPRVLPWSRSTIVAIGLALFVLVASARLATDSSSTVLTMLYVLPIALLAIEFGLPGGLLSALTAIALLVAWVLLGKVDLATHEVLLRCTLLAILGVGFGLLGDRLAQAGDLIADQVLYMESLTVHGLVRLDRSGHITAWNRGATETLGYSKADAQSQPLALILGGEEEGGPMARQMLEGAAHNGVWDGEGWVVEKGAQRRWAAISVTPLADGGDAGFALVLRDLTATRAARHESSRMWDVRAHEDTRLVPVVILTSSHEEIDLIATYGHGANSYVRKPVDFNRFAESVRQLGLYWLVVNEAPPILTGA